MQDWSLGPGDPLVLTLAADFRLCTTDYFNDHIWEIEIGGDPHALALRTTYGLRALAMRLFHRFRQGSNVVMDPATFFAPPRLRRFYPNFFQFNFSPFENIDVKAEYWVPESHAAACHLKVTNQSGHPVALLLELCGQLAPLNGQRLAPVSMHSVNVLVGQTSNLAPVIFLTGGPNAGPGPYPSLAIDLTLDPGSSRNLTWVEAALATASDSFELARRISAREWEAELARIERINASQTVQIRTGDPDWDAAFALSQRTAFSLFLSPTKNLPCPSFVLARQPEHGYSQRGDGMDYSQLWNGQPAIEACYLASVLPGAAELAAGLVRNFLSTQTKEGGVDWKPGLAGQRGHWSATPLLASLAWQVYRRTFDQGFLHEIITGLDAFIQSWFKKQHDRDLDGFPEWNHPLQTGLEDNPAFTIWQEGGQGAAISTAESPALSAMLFKEIRSLARIAVVLEQPQMAERLELKSEGLRQLTEACWDDTAVLYHYRDRDSHRCQPGKSLGKLRVTAKASINQSFPQPVRLLIQFNFENESTHLPEIILHGMNGEVSQSERLERLDFQRCMGVAVATSQLLYTRLNKVEIASAKKNDQVSMQVMDFSGEDISLFLPVWAEIPDQWRGRALITWTLLAADRFGKPFGIPTCPTASSATTPETSDTALQTTCQAVHLPWNVLVGEGLLNYDMREEAAQIITRLMAAVIQNLKRNQAFFRAYHCETGAGIGERNSLHGLAPVGLFLSTLGVEIHSPTHLTLTGKNPFPWPVTVKYRGLTVTRRANQTEVVFPDGQRLTLNDPTNATITAD